MSEISNYFLFGVERSRTITNVKPDQEICIFKIKHQEPGVEAKYIRKRYKVLKVYPGFIICKPLDSKKSHIFNETFNLGDLVMAGLEPSYI